MQSSVPSDFTIETYHATLHDIKNFKQFIERIEIDRYKDGAIKIIPPPQFQPRSRAIPYNTKFSNVVDQKAGKIIINNGCAYELSYDTNISMLLKEFIAQTVLNEISTTNTAELEDLAWSILEKGTGISLYSMNNDMSLFDDSCQWLNLNKFTNAESLIHNPDVVNMRGINTPYVYVGSWPTYFGFHIEDANLNSINYLHRGAPKIWYIVSPEDGQKLEQLGNQCGKSVLATCTNFLRHKALSVPPTTLKQYGIRFSRIVQNPNEFVVTFSGGYHCGFNAGLNEAEAINFGTTRWLEMFPNYQPCDCRGRRINCMHIKNNLVDIYDASIATQKKKIIISV